VAIDKMFATLPLELTAQIIGNLTNPADINALRLTGSEGYHYATEFVTTLDRPCSPKPPPEKSRCFKADYILQFKRLQTCPWPIVVTSLAQVNDLAKLSNLNNAIIAMYEPEPDAKTEEAAVSEASTTFDSVSMMPHIQAIVLQYQLLALINGNIDSSYTIDQLKNRVITETKDRCHNRPADYYYHGVAAFILNHRLTSSQLTQCNIKFNCGVTHGSSGDSIYWKGNYLSLPVNTEITRILEVLPTSIEKISLNRVGDETVFTSILDYLETKAPLPHTLSIHPPTYSETTIKRLLNIVTSIRIRVVPWSIHNDLHRITHGLEALRDCQFPQITRARIPITLALLPRFITIFPSVTSVDLIHDDIHDDAQPIQNPQSIFSLYPQLNRIRIYTHDIPVPVHGVGGLAIPPASELRNPSKFQKQVLLR
jgi:hypothetical protein